MRNILMILAFVVAGVSGYVFHSEQPNTTTISQREHFK